MPVEAKEFGAFVQSCRKELGLSQSELANQLHVTAKAISRWERGVGFPDIKLLEPLADALGITLIELMQSKRMEQSLPAETAVSVISDSVASIREQDRHTRKQQRDLVLGTLAIGGGASFLWCLGRYYPFDPRWIGSLLRLIALTGGVLGWRAFYSILTGSYLKTESNSPWNNWKPWAACCISLLGLVNCIWLKYFFPRGSTGYSCFVLTGMAALLPGAYWLHKLLIRTEEES